MDNTKTTTAVGNQASVQHTPSVLESVAPILLMLFAFYFLMIRPQQKREEKKKSMRSSLKKGDKVITVGGIVGVIHKVIGDNEVSLEIAEGVNIKMLKSSVAGPWEGDVSQTRDAVKEKKTKTTKSKEKS